MKGFIIYPTYKIINGEPYVLLYGRLENNQSFLTLNKFKPYFYIKSGDLSKAKKLAEFEAEKTEFTNFQGDSMTKLVINYPKDVSDIRRELEGAKIKTYESDIRFPIRFLIDHNIQGSLEIEGDYEGNEAIDRIYKDPDIKSTDYIPKNLKILSFDIESDKLGKKIYCISLYSKNYENAFIVSKDKVPRAVSCKDEAELLEKFREAVLDLDPDIITGWNVIDFDLQYLRDKFKKYRIPFDLGRENTPTKLRLETNFFRTSKADMPGRVVLDGIDLTKSSFIKLENYKLDTAAESLLGTGKLIKDTGKQKYNEIDRLFKEDQKKLIEYNILDSELAYRIVTEANLIDLAIQRSLLTGMSLDRVNASISSLDFLYLQKTKERKLVAPTTINPEREARIKGGYVMNSIPGIYDNLIVLDFKSLYPSMIRTFNIDPYTFSEKRKKGFIEAPNKTYFDISKEGILPGILEKIWAERDEAKKKKNKLAIQAIKIIMLSFWGVLANPTCRFYNLKMANGLTGFGRHIIKQTAQKVEDLGYNVIYSDTDSVFVDTKEKSEIKADQIGKKLEKEINGFYKKHIKEEYHRESNLELEYEKLYLRFLMPKIRGGEAGAKKRYAGLLKKDGKEKLDIVGLETVRSDWTNAAKKFQQELLDKIFHKEEVTKFIKKFVEDIQNGKYDEDLVYRKSIRKDLEEYTKTTPPHVKAARKLKKLESSTIEYYMTTAGPEPIQLLKHDLDYEHYIEKQIKPIADTMLSFFNIAFEDLIKGSTQSTLFGY
jgi:DNA polymerase II